MQNQYKPAVDALLKQYKCANLTELNKLLLKEYKVSSDVAEGIELANGLREAFRACVEAGEMTEAEYLFACAQGLDEIRERVGTDSRSHKRRAKLAQNRLVMCNFGLVLIVARKELGAEARTEALLEEACQAGSIGVMQATEYFEEDKGIWSVYARWKIRYQIQNCMRNLTEFSLRRSQRMPPEVVEQVNCLRTAKGKVDFKDLTRKGKAVTETQWKAWTEHPQVHSFDDLNTHHGPHDNQTWEGNGSLDFIADERTNPDLLIANANLSEKLQATLSEMSPRHADIARALFVDGDSVPEVVEKFHISDRRIHEIKRMLADRLRKVLQA